MNTEPFKKALLEKQADLESQITRASSEGRDARTAEVEDPMDYVTSSQGQAAAFEETSRLSDELEAVRAALQRIDDGTYGRCIDCGREIGEARLKAVPWTAYCKEDQEKRDARQQPTDAFGAEA